MLGRTHVASGPVVALAALPLVNEGMNLIGAPEIAGPAVLAYTAASLGAAALPDIDHQGATVSKALGPITQGVSAVVGTVFGGHRQGTHSVLGAALFGALTWGIARWNEYAYGAWLAFLVVVASAALFKEFRKSSIIFHVIFSLAAATGLVYLSGTQWMPVESIVAGVVIGVVAHALGDAPTKDGIPPLWPLSFRIRGPLTTGDPWEQVVFALLLVALPVLLFTTLMPAEAAALWSLVVG